MIGSSLLLAVALVAHDPGYMTSLANHLRRWLAGEGIVTTVTTPKTLEATLAKERLAFLLGFNEPTAREMRVLRSFRARGGKLVVFHSASPELGELMGVRPLGYTTAPTPGRWSRMDFAAPLPTGFPAHILQTSTVLQRAAPLPGKSRVLATWSDRAGRPTGDAAWLSSAGGYWMTHILTADGDEHLKARLLAAIVGSVEPGKWNFKAHLARENAKAQQACAAGRALAKRPGEIHAVWDHSGCGLYPGNWPRTIQLLKARHLTDLFVNVAGAGFAHYPSAVLPRSKTFRQEGDQLAAAVAAARGSGVRVHAWILCFTTTRATPDQQALFARRGWRLKTREGTLSDYLDPSNAGVRAYLLSAVDEIQSRYAVDGIHLDFVRWFERAQKPANATAPVTRFVSDVRRHVKRPKWLTTAVLGKYPACVASVGQDWTSWIDMNLVDYVVPMDYTESAAAFAAYVAQHAATPLHARKTIAGIGVTANESRLDARQVATQIQMARAKGLAGVALFDLDVLLEKRILPYLVLGGF